MRFLHTADWHLGRLFHGVSLTEDQHHVLEQLVAVAREARLDAVVIAGDVYDRTVPPAEAVEVLDEVLSRLVLDLRLPVIAIAGNHDSPQRLAFGRRFLQESRLHVFGLLDPEPRPVVLEDARGPVSFWAVPYVDPPTARSALGTDTIHDHDAALREVLSGVRKHRSPAGRSVLVTHAFVAGGEESESERPLSVGGIATVDARTLAGFDYVALGHLHRPQKVGSDTVRYSGSLLKYSFSEAAHRKVVQIVDMDESGACTIEDVRLTPRRDLREVGGLLADLLRGPGPGESADDYLLIHLLDTGAVFDAMSRLRAVYPHVLHIDRPALDPDGTGDGHRIDPQRMTETELFRTFFADVTGEALPSEGERAFGETLEEMRRDEREAKP